MISYFRTWKVHKYERMFCREISLHRTECLPISSWSVSLFINSKHEKKASVSIDHALLNWPSATIPWFFLYRWRTQGIVSRVSCRPGGIPALFSALVQCSGILDTRATLYCTHGRYIHPKCSALVPPYWFKLLIVNLSPSRSESYVIAATTMRIFFGCLFMHSAQLLWDQSASVIEF